MISPIFDDQTEFPENPQKSKALLPKSDTSRLLQKLTIMKKAIFIFTLLLFCFQYIVIAQSARAGIDAGVSISNMNVSGATFNSGDSKTGFTVGMIVDFPCKKKSLQKFSLQPGLHYVTKGMITDKSSNGVSSELKVVVNYAELAFNVLYNAANSSGGNFFAGLGPTISSGLPGAKTIYKGSPSDIIFGHTEGATMRRWDYGANFVAGYRFKNGVFFSANYTLGLKNLLPEDRDGQLKNTAIGIKVGILMNNETTK
jgi:hypothetical protein